MKTNLLGKPRTELENLIRPLTAQRYRTEQVAHWILQRHATSFDEMSNLPLNFRAELKARFSLESPTVVQVESSTDGASKFLFELADRSRIEGVSIPEGRKLTLCLSSQSGCALGCSFCITAKLGGGRNLAASEIVGQYRSMLQHAGPEVERVNIVFMGMGEPLLNLEELSSALEVLYERVSPRRITVSTAGVVPGIDALAGFTRRPKLAVSLNAPDQARRMKVMPIARKYPLEVLMDALRRFPLERGRRMTFEYVLMQEFNDSDHDAQLLARLLRGIPAKVNVIPLNEDAEYLADLKQPTRERILAFTEHLREAGLTATVRWSRGEDVNAACGQLKAAGSASRTTIES